MDLNQKIQKIAGIARLIYSRHQGYMEHLISSSKEIERNDFIWHFLLQSFATMGKASGWIGLVGNKENYRQLSFDNLSLYKPEERHKIVLEVCKKAKIRMPGKKAEYILGCFDLIVSMGGLIAAKEKLLAQPGREGKIAFLMLFPGIGPKYARNIMMDVYHEEFRESIAIDVRITSISELIGVSFNNYSEHEKFLLKVAHAANMNGWELDRLMYNFRAEFEAEIVNNLTT